MQYGETREFALQQGNLLRVRRTRYQSHGRARHSNTARPAIACRRAAHGRPFALTGIGHDL
jgi:hypothetical protein